MATYIPPLPCLPTRPSCRCSTLRATVECGNWRSALFTRHSTCHISGPLGPPLHLTAVELETMYVQGVQSRVRVSGKLFVLYASARSERCHCARRLFFFGNLPKMFENYGVINHSIVNLTNSNCLKLKWKKLSKNSPQLQGRFLRPSFVRN